MLDGGELTSLGSGFIIDREGHILTNRHVVDGAVDGAGEIVVRFARSPPTGRALDRQIDAQSNLALLKIEAEDLRPVNVLENGRIRVGDWVLAIGSPFGFSYSASSGIVSAVERNLPADRYTPFIQTDVAINPGHSGGPLFDLQGKIVGVNTQIYSRSGGFNGLSFAIPIEVAMDVAAQLRDRGRVVRGWLGVRIQNVTAELAESFALSSAQGALVSQIVAAGPARGSALQITGDIIIGFNGQPVHSAQSLPPLVGRAPIGQLARLDIVRDGHRQSLLVKIEELPGTLAPARVTAAAAEPKRANLAALSATFAGLNSAQREREGLPQGGVLVVDVRRGAAHSAGLRAGDIVLAIGGRNIVGLSDFVEQIEALPTASTLAILMSRDGARSFLPLQLPE